MQNTLKAAFAHLPSSKLIIDYFVGGDSYDYVLQVYNVPLFYLLFSGSITTNKRC